MQGFERNFLTPDMYTFGIYHLVKDPFADIPIKFKGKN